MSKNLQRYQWTKGDRLGEVETLNKIEGKWVYFSSGRRIANNLIEEFMTPIQNEGQIMDIPGQTTSTPYSFKSEGSDNTIMDAEGNVFNRPKAATVKAKTNTNIVAETQIEVSKKEKSPVRLLLEQASSDKVKVEVPVTIEIPKKTVYKIIKESFDVNLDEEIKSMILEKLDQNKFKELLTEQIGVTIDNHYNK
tara:strand:+ start:3537 stop:4118 length:582 start_codon:yes stop_codon:yes gene_type:complete